MPSKINPRPGEVWRTKLADGRIAACFIYLDDITLYRAWMGVPWSPDIVPNEEMIDGENGWKRVYKPATDYSGLFVPLKK